MCPDSSTLPTIAPKKAAFRYWLNDLGVFINAPTPDSVFDSIFTDRVLEGSEELTRRFAKQEAHRVCILTATTGEAEALRKKLKSLHDPADRPVIVALTGSPAAAERHAFQPLRSWIVALWLSDKGPSLRRHGLRWAGYLAFQSGADDVIPIETSGQIDQLAGDEILGLLHQSLARQAALDCGEIDDCQDCSDAGVHDLDENNAFIRVTPEQWLVSAENPASQAVSAEELIQVTWGLRANLREHEDQSALQRAWQKLAVWEKTNRVAFDAVMGWLEVAGDKSDVGSAREIIQIYQNEERQVADAIKGLNEPVESLAFCHAIDRLARWKHATAMSGMEDDSRYERVMEALRVAGAGVPPTVAMALAARLQALQNYALKMRRWDHAGKLACDPTFDSSQTFRTEEAASFYATQRMNAEAAVLYHGNQVLLLVEEPGSEVAMAGHNVKFRLLGAEAARHRYMNQKIKYEYEDSKGDTRVKKITILDLFMEHPWRRQFLGLTCERYSADDATPISDRRYSKEKLYNTVGDFGWGCEPVPRNQFDASKIGRIQHHIEHILCSDDPMLIEFLYDWLSDLVQNPQSKPGTCIVLKSPEGAGKGMIAKDLLSRIIGPGFKHMFNKEHLLGKFNFQLADAHLVYADELFWGGDKQAEGILKGLITESTINLELKNKDAIEVPFPARIIISSNEDWIVPAGNESRRYVVLELSDERIGDRDYFNALGSEIATGAEHFFRFLLDRDLKRPGASDLRVSPVTRGLIDQRERSAGGTYEWWRSFLDSGQFTDRSEGGVVTIHWTQDRALGSKTIQEAVASYYRTSGKRYAPTWVSVVADLKKFCPLLSDARQRIDGVQQRGLQLPDLADARKCLEDYIGGTLTWSPLPDGRAAAKQLFQRIIKQILESKVQAKDPNGTYAGLWPIGHLVDVTLGLDATGPIWAKDAKLALTDNGINMEGGIVTIDLTHVTIAHEIGRRIARGSLEDYAMAAGEELRNGCVALNWLSWTTRAEELAALVASHGAAANFDSHIDDVFH